MKYYSITTDEENGVQVIHEGRASDPIYTKKLYETYPSRVINDLILDLEPGVKKTDVLECGGLNLKGLIISSKCYELLKDFSLDNIQFVDILGNGLDGFKFMFFNGDLTHKIDYISSDFKLYQLSIIKKKFEELEFEVPSNREAIIKIDIDVVSRSARKKIFPCNGYVFEQGFDLEGLDVFRMGHFDLNFYISERVKKVLEEHKITGCKYIEQKML